MKIRKAKESDIDDIYNIYKAEEWRPFIDEKCLVEKLILDSNSKFIIAEADDQVIGFARYLTDNVFKVFLAEIIVDENHRKIGVGRAIIDAVSEQNKGLIIDLITDNPKFYQTLGFKKVGDGYRKVLKTNAN